jgi:type IV pilus assembly protein PilV
MEPIVMTSNNHGFTLIEFLVAIVILMVGLLGMLQAINVAMNENLGNLFRNEAVMLADDRMMIMRAKSFDSITPTVANPPATTVPRDIRGIVKNYAVQEIVTQTTSLSKEIVINISWTKKNSTFNHSISSVVSTFPQ